MPLKMPRGQNSRSVSRSVDRLYAVRISLQHLGECGKPHSIVNLLPPNTNDGWSAAKLMSSSAVRKGATNDRGRLPSRYGLFEEEFLSRQRAFESHGLFRGCAPLAFRLTVADPNYRRSIWSSRTFVAVGLALDPVLKRVPRLGELSNNLVATLSSAIFTHTGRKLQGLPNDKSYGKPFSAPASGEPPCPAALRRCGGQSAAARPRGAAWPFNGS